jgi:hypothetical protein
LDIGPIHIVAQIDTFPTGLPTELAQYAAVSEAEPPDLADFSVFARKGAKLSFLRFVSECLRISFDVVVGSLPRLAAISVNERFTRSPFSISIRWD